MQKASLHEAVAFTMKLSALGTRCTVFDPEIPSYAADRECQEHLPRTILPYARRECRINFNLCYHLRFEVQKTFWDQGPDAETDPVLYRRDVNIMGEIESMRCLNGDAVMPSGRSFVMGQEGMFPAITRSFVAPGTGRGAKGR